MIGMVIASAVTMVAMQASINAPRSTFAACLTEAKNKALADKVAAADYGAFVKQACAAKSSSLHSALVAFDVKNGIARTRAIADADMQIDDYFTSAAEHYESRVKVAAATE